VLSHKLVLVGDTHVGKTCIASRFVRDEFHDTVQSTIGAAFLVKNIPLDDAIVRFEVWDTAGQERYRSLVPMYYRDASACLVVFDVTSRESFNGAKAWVNELKRRAPPGILIAFAGNKSDLPNQVVSKDEANEYARDSDIIYMPTSAKTGMGVPQLFEAIARRVPRTQKAVSEPLLSSPAPASTSCCK